MDAYIGADILDSRDIIERMTELEAIDAADRDQDDAAELAAWQAFATEASTVGDWEYGETFVRESYFEDYARELAEDIGAVSDDHTWPNSYIDWPAAADALLMDYTAFTLDGITYYARS